MNGLSDHELLRSYARRRNEGAFAELVRRHLDFVYSTALRMVHDRHRAEDVTQSVFVVLARDADRLSNHERLEGWLHRTTRNIAAEAVRTEVRRQHREKEANVANEPESHPFEPLDWNLISGELDAALQDLSESDREAVFLRYFRRQTARDMARLLGTSEEAAQKRVTRAVERLREVFASRGLRTATPALSAALLANAVFPAPPALAASILSATTVGTTVTALVPTASALAMTTLQKSLATLAVVLALGTAWYQTQKASSARAASDSLRARYQAYATEVARLTLENQELRDQAVRTSNSLARATAQHVELLRLRGEVGVLRARHPSANASTLGKAPGPAPASQPEAPPPPAAPPFELRLVVEEGTEGAESLPPGEGSVPAGSAGENLKVDKAALMDHTTIHSASVVLDAQSGLPRLEIDFTDQGREMFARVTREHLNQRIAVAIDGSLYAAPVIRSEITGGKAVVTGHFTEEQAWQLAAKINLALQRH